MTTTNEPDGQGGPALVAAVIAARREIKYIQAKGFNRQHKYTYVSEADILDAVRPVMDKHGLALFPISVELNSHSPVDKKRFTTLVVTWWLAHTSGEGQMLTMSGEGFDTLDKGPGKAHTSALKSLLRQLFLISTGDQAMDTEFDGAPQQGPGPPPGWGGQTPMQQRYHEEQQYRQAPPPQQQGPPPGYFTVGPGAPQGPLAQPPMQQVEPQQYQQPQPPRYVQDQDPRVAPPPREQHPPQPPPAQAPPSQPRPAPPPVQAAPAPPAPPPVQSAPPPPPRPVPAPPPMQEPPPGAPPTPRHFRCGACNLTHLSIGPLEHCPNCGVTDQLVMLPLAAQRGPMPVGDASIPAPPPPPPQAPPMRDQWWFAAGSAAPSDRLFQGQDFAAKHCGWTYDQIKAAVRDCGIDLDDPSGSTITDQRVDSLFTIIQNPPQ
jgi:hypothetical protein